MRAYKKESWPNLDLMLPWSIMFGLSFKSRRKEHQSLQNNKLQNPEEGRRMRLKVAWGKAGWKEGNQISPGGSDSILTCFHNDPIKCIAFPYDQWGNYMHTYSTVPVQKPLFHHFSFSTYLTSHTTKTKCQKCTFPASPEPRIWRVTQSWPVEAEGKSSREDSYGIECFPS